jgi:predicted GNAT family acetyltransferase
MKSELTDSSLFIPHPLSFARSSLVLASLDIGRVLADRDGVTFRAQGTCMYPTIRPGDVLRIQSRAAAQVNISDLAVCRGHGFLFSHRVIAKGERDGRAFIITRPDRAHEGSDRPTFDENLLGVVVAIERKGKRVPLQPTAYPGLARWYYAVRLAVIEAAPRTQLWLANVLARAQRLTRYRKIARCWVALARPRITYSVQLPLNGKLGESVHRRLSPEEFDPQMEWRGRAVERWTLALRLSDAREPAACATFVRDKDHAWRVEESYVRARYRGAGLDDALIRQAEAIVARSGMALQRTPE